MLARNGSEYSYTLTEGKEFVVDRPLYLTLTFKATDNNEVAEDAVD